MKRILDYDPLTKETNWFEYDSQTDTTTLSTYQDVEAILEDNLTLRNDPEYTKHGIKKEMWHYAVIPNVVMMECFKRGINPYRKEDDKRFFALLESEYPYLKTTTKKHKPR